jgi:hypothetical protein
MLSKNSSRPDVRTNFVKYLQSHGHPFDAICLAESSSCNIGIEDLLPDYQIYQSELVNTRLYRHGFKFAIAYTGDCIVKAINYPTNDFPNQAFINSNENEGYCMEQLFSIILGKKEVVAVHIQAVDSRKEMKELSKYSHRTGLSKMTAYMSTNKPDVVIGDFNLHRKALQNKISESLFDISGSGYSFVDLSQDVNGGKIHHALRKGKAAHISYVDEVHTHLTTAMVVEIKV